MNGASLTNEDKSGRAPSDVALNSVASKSIGFLLDNRAQDVLERITEAQLFAIADKSITLLMHLVDLGFQYPIHQSMRLLLSAVRGKNLDRVNWILKFDPTLAIPQEMHHSISVSILDSESRRICSIFRGYLKLQNTFNQEYDTNEAFQPMTEAKWRYRIKVAAESGKLKVHEAIKKFKLSPAELEEAESIYDSTIYKRNMKKHRRKGYSVLQFSAKEGNVRGCRCGIQRCKSVNHRSRNGDSALMRAAQKGHVQAPNENLDRFLRQAPLEAIKNLAIADWTDSAIVVAFVRGLPVCHALIKSGQASDRHYKMETKDAPDFLTEFRDDGDEPEDTLLTICAMFGHTELIELMVDNGFDINQGGNIGLTPLGYAIVVCQAETCRLLVERGAAMVDDGNSSSAMHLAAEYGTPEILEILLRAGHDVSLAIDEETPLHNAAEHGTVENFEWLLGQGAELGTRGFNNRSALEYTTLG
ncbi:ankyrin repeat-containing domain protein [Gorgonomyces haynaldii]|nr:ankyrin repeat-containing domain protein [Gorgonomyces haynaldii]